MKIQTEEVSQNRYPTIRKAVLYSSLQCWKYLQPRDIAVISLPITVKRHSSMLARYKAVCPQAHSDSELPTSKPISFLELSSITTSFTFLSNQYRPHP